MKRHFRPLGLIAVALVVSQCHEAPITGPRRITSLPRALTNTETGLVTADNRFAFTLFQQVVRQGSPDSNLFLSPLSAAMALTMAYNGAAGVTQSEMQRTLALDGMTVADVDHSYHSLITLLQQLDPAVTFTIGNSVWFRSEFTPMPSFLDATRTYFSARAQGLDFSSPTAADTINAWVSAETRGKIPAIVDPPIPADLVAYLINAIYFKGDWTEQFDKNLTTPTPFTLRDGGTTPAQMMSHGVTVDVGFHAEPDAVVLDLPYGGTAFSMTIVLPRTADGIDSLPLALDEARWTAWTAALSPMELYVYLPKFTVTYGLTMNDVLKALGMPSAFCDSPQANFPGIVANHVLCISDVKHKAFVDVNEEGTEASAATSVGIAPTSVPPSVVVDHPFIFAIRERLSGTILFMGRLMHPIGS